MLRHHHPEKHRFALLGRLVGYLLLCCTCESEGKSHEAAKAVRHLCLFVTQQRSERSCVGPGPSRHRHSQASTRPPGPLSSAGETRASERASSAALPRADELFPLP